MRYQRDPRATSTDSGDDIVVSGHGPGQVVYLDRTASTIWRLIEEPRSAEEVVAVFVEQYPTSPREEIDRELRQFLASLVEHELAVLRAEPDEAAQGADRPA